MFSNEKRMQYRGKTIRLKENPRIGICNWCCAVVGINCKRTHLHHYAEYHDDDPLKDTVEICHSCHNKEHHRLGLWSNRTRDWKGRYK